MVNTISESELVAIPAGKVMDPQIGQLETYFDLSTPGKYTITLIYEFDPSGRDKVESTVLLQKMQKLPAARAEGKTEVTILPFPLEVTKADEKVKAATAPPRHPDRHTGRPRPS